jgi:hypothetical protein
MRRAPPDGRPNPDRNHSRPVSTARHRRPESRHRKRLVHRPSIRDRAYLQNLKQWVILNKRVPDIILASLVDDPEKYVRMWVARKRKLSMVSLEKLANDRADVVRREVVHHRKINRQILNILAQDEEPVINKGLQCRFKRFLRHTSISHFLMQNAGSWSRDITQNYLKASFQM